MVETKAIEKINKNFTVLEANTIFLVLAGVFLTLGAYVQSREVLSGLLITEYGIVLLPIILYSLATRKNLKKVFRLNRLSIKSIFQIIGVAITLLPIIVLANLITLWIVELFSDSILSEIPTANNQSEYLILMFIISITAGICEEGFFRGMVLNAYETKVGRRWGAIFSGILFGVFHFNPQNFLGPIVLGIVFSYLVQVTNSIWASVIAHATNNGIAVTMGYVINKFMPAVDVESMSGASLSPSEILIVIAFYGGLALITIFALVYLLKQIKKDHPDLKRGNAINIQGHQYNVLGVKSEMLYLQENPEDIESLKAVRLNDLKHYKFDVLTPFWEKSPLKLSVLEIFPLVLTLIMYGYIIYYAYF